MADFIRVALSVCDEPRAPADVEAWAGTIRGVRIHEKRFAQKLLVVCPVKAVPMTQEPVFRIVKRVSDACAGFATPIVVVLTSDERLEEDALRTIKSALEWTHPAVRWYLTEAVELDRGAAMRASQLLARARTSRRHRKDPELSRRGGAPCPVPE